MNAAHSLLILFETPFRDNPLEITVKIISAFSILSHKKRLMKLFLSFDNVTWRYKSLKPMKVKFNFLKNLWWFLHGKNLNPEGGFKLFKLSFGSSEFTKLFLGKLFVRFCCGLISKMLLVAIKLKLLLLLIQLNCPMVLMFRLRLFDFRPFPIHFAVVCPTERQFPARFLGLDFEFERDFEIVH